MRLLPRSTFWRIVLAVVIAIIAYVIITALVTTYLLRQHPKSGGPVAYADSTCPSAPPHGNDTGWRLMYNGVCTPVLLEPSAPRAALSSTSSRGAVPAAAGPTSCSWVDRITLAGVGVDIADITVTEPFTEEPFSNLDNFPSPPVVQTTITPAGTLAFLSTDSTSFYAYGSKTFSPNMYSQIRVLGNWVIDQGSPVAVAQITLNLDAYIDSPTAAYPDPCNNPDGFTWSLTTTTLAGQIAGGVWSVWNALSWAISRAWDQTIWSLCGLFGGSC